MKAHPPYERSGIGQLETLFAITRNQIGILRDLIEKLDHRKVPRAQDLLGKLRKQSAFTAGD